MKNVKSPFRYAGGKFYALKYLLPIINNISHKEFREPFVGGGSVFFGKKPTEINWINDIDSELINTYSVIQNRTDASKLIKLLDGEIASKERHEEIKSYKPTSKLDRAYKYYYLNRTSYSGIMKTPAWGYKEGKSSPPKNWGAMIDKVVDTLQNVKITSIDFEEVIKSSSKYLDKEVLLYLDPPYFEADQKRAYSNHFVYNEHVRLREALQKTQFKFLLSYDDVDGIRDLYDWAHIRELEWNYNTSNLKSTRRKVGKELIISNFTL